MLSIESAKLLLALLDTATISAKVEVIAAVTKARTELEKIVQEHAVMS